MVPKEFRLVELRLLEFDIPCDSQVFNDRQANTLDRCLHFESWDE